MPSSTPCEVTLVSSAFVEERWDEISHLLEAAFSAAKFLEEGPTTERPAQSIWKEIHEPGGSKLGHVVAVGSDEEILGGLFSLPIDRAGDETDCDVGWFFTVETLSDAQREEIADAVMQRGHEELAKAGYETVVTAMRTEAIAHYMSWRHRYLPAPLGDVKDRWVKSLRTAPEGGDSDNSARRKWESVSEQHARYATADIGKDDVIVDLKTAMRRVSQAGPYTLQLGEGYHYQTSERGLGINHHCSPNGYFCFDDMTYRALCDVSAGEELTFHYCTTEFEMAAPFDCVCGSPNCVGRVGGFKFLDEAEVEKLFSLLSPFIRSKL
jgi:hypothetical protein